MSKTKGNVIDPLEIIQRFGTDATRFTLAAMAAPGTDIAFSESRTDGYRAFANKIWNAARFMFMNVDRVEPGMRPAAGSETKASIDAAAFQHTLEDRWILSQFNYAAKDVNYALRTYRFHEAANRIYDFFWGDLCDWYIELIKPRLAVEDGADKSAARLACANLLSVFEASLRLLHPVMPFITEEIWHAIYDGKPPLKSIALAQFPLAGAEAPEPPGVLTGSEALDHVNFLILQDLIVNVRNLRAESKVDGKMKVPLQVFSHDPETWTVIEQNRDAIRRLANVESITEVAQADARQAPSRGTARFDVRLVYEQKIDVGAERERLKKELEKIEKEIANGQRQLSNEQFLAKAPPQVVEGIRKRAAELVVLLEKTQSKLKELG
jgi:valyl-tRNA synthetase